MNFNELVIFLDHLSAPIGPLGDFDARQMEREKWLESVTVDYIPLLINVLKSPKQDLIKLNIDAGNCYFEASEALGALGKQNSNQVFSELENILDKVTSFIPLLETIEIINDPMGISILTNIFLRYKLNEEEVLSLISAAGAIKYLETRDLLNKIESKYSSFNIEEELKIARN